MDKTGHTDTLPEQYQMMKDFCKSAQQHGAQVTVGDVRAVETTVVPTDAELTIWARVCER